MADVNSSEWTGASTNTTTTGTYITDDWGNIINASGSGTAQQTYEQAKMWKELMAQQAYQGLGNYPTAQNSTRPSWSLEQRLAMRMNVDHLRELPFDFIQPVKNEKGENVTIFALKDGKPLTFEDDPNLFPSDSLVSKLNLLR